MERLAFYPVIKLLSIASVAVAVDDRREVSAAVAVVAALRQMAHQLAFDKLIQRISTPHSAEGLTVLPLPSAAVAAVAAVLDKPRAAVAVTEAAADCEDRS